MYSSRQLATDFGVSRTTAVGAYERLREPVRCTAYLPDIDGVLPVYVADRYERFRAVTFSELDDAGLERYLGANVAAHLVVEARVSRAYAERE